MAEPTSSVMGAIGSAMLGVAAFLAGIDGMALLGAMSGSALYTMHSKEQSVTKRIVFCCISVIAGYYGWTNVQELTPINGAFFSAFVLSAVVVTAIAKVLEKINGADIGELIASIIRK